MIITLFIITGLYLVIIYTLIFGLKKVKEFTSTEIDSNIEFSIIIPFRNEEQNLPKLLTSILALNYSEQQFECLFVNDDSSDTSVETIHQYLKESTIAYEVLQNNRASNSPKKDAITTAIHQSKFDWIITTDADCSLPQKWLSEFAAFSTINNSKMIVGPVMYLSDDFSFLEHFQILDILSLQGATIGGFGIGKPFLCNGANLAYEKNTFLQLNGFDGNNTIASGDDIFLFEKFYETYPKQVHFLKSTSAIAHTNAVKTWKELINQRMRWAAKSSSYKLWFGKWVGLVVLLMNLCLIFSFIMVFIDRGNSTNLLACIILKIGADTLLIQRTSYFYRGKSKKIRDLEFSSLFYPFFSVFIVLRTLFGKYTWKGRKFKK